MLYIAIQMYIGPISIGTFALKKQGHECVMLSMSGVFSSIFRFKVFFLHYVLLNCHRKTDSCIIVCIHLSINSILNPVLDRVGQLTNYLAS